MRRAAYSRVSGSASKLWRSTPQIISSMMGLPMEGSMVLIMIGGIMGHVIFGIVVAMFAKEQAEYQSKYFLKGFQLLKSETIFIFKIFSLSATTKSKLITSNVIITVISIWKRTNQTKKHSTMTWKLNIDIGLQRQINEHQVVTGGIFFCRDGADFSVSASNKLLCKLTEKCFEIGNKNIQPFRWR